MGLNRVLFEKYFFPLRKRRSTAHSGLKRPLWGAFWAIALTLLPALLVACLARLTTSGLISRYLFLTTYPIIARGPRDDETAKNLIVSLSKETPSLQAILEKDSAAVLFSQTQARSTALRGVSSLPLWAEKEKGFLVTSPSQALSSPRCAILGATLAQKLGVHLGDTVKMLVGRQFGHKTAFQVRSHIVCALARSGYEPIDDGQVIIPLSGNRGVFSSADQIVGLLNVSPKKARSLSRQLEQRKPSWSWQSWEKTLSGQMRYFNAVENSLLIILFLIALSAFAQLALLLSLLKKSLLAEALRLRLLGERPSQIRALLLLALTLVGGGGALTGAVFAIALAFLFGPTVAALSAFLPADSASSAALHLYLVSALHLADVPWATLVAVITLWTLISVGLGALLARSATRPLETLMQERS